ncbi:hypothetical protein BC834DRAFT_966777 [Gloeopeniophorella convolvens]|nr:hypothetical protein BC834DRAFT_966777 [Gloeopeniophorella convolvens]
MPIFDGIKFFCTSTLSEDRRTELALLLQHNGAKSVSLEDATHIVTLADDFEGRDNVREETALVTDYWVDRSLILGRLQLSQHFSPDPCMLFSGVVACATDLTPSDIEVLSAGITALGGQWRAGLTRDVTHLFAVGPGSEKYQTALHYQKDTQIRVVVPHWFDDSVRLGIRGLSTSVYEWPEPTIFTHGRPNTEDGDAGGSSLRPQSKFSQEKKALYRAALMTAEQEAKLGQAEVRDIWGQRRILLSSDLDLSSDRRLAVEAGIVRSGGVVVEYNAERSESSDPDYDFDVLVARYRWGDLYVQGVNRRKLIGSLTWLFHVESTGNLSTPTAQLLHYPIPKKPIEGFSAHEITVTNYTGEARDYLKKLISLMGATFTPSMSGKNTVLIAAFISGNKATKARNWSIPVVNHTWLEDCFIQWRNLSVGLEKYVTFTPGLDFSAHLGERGIQREVIQDGLSDLVAEMALTPKAASAPEDEGPDDHDAGNQPPTPPITPRLRTYKHTPSASKRQRRLDSDATEDEDEAPPTKRSVLTKTMAAIGSPAKGKEKAPQKPPSNAAPATPRRQLSVLMPPVGTGEALLKSPHLSPKKTSPTKGKPKSRAVAPEEEASSSGQYVRPRPSLAAETSMDQEEVSFRQGSRRSAANKASQRLRDEIMPDVVNFEKEMRRGRVQEANFPDAKHVKDGTKASTKAAGKKRASLHPEPENATSSDDDRARKKRRVGGVKDRSRSIAEDDGEPASGTEASSQEREAQSSKSGVKKAKSKNPRADGDSSDCSVRVLVTQVTLGDDAERAMTKLGAKMGVKPGECTHLVVKNLGRTEKFLCAMAVAPVIITEKWVQACVAAKKLLSPDKYVLVDPSNEKKWKFKLADALKRAKANRGQLFAGMTFFVTNKVPVDKKLLKNIVAAHGGQIRQQNPTTRVLNGKPDNYVISCPEDASIWRPIAEAGHTIYSQELILNAALTQEINLDDEAYQVHA